MEKFKELYFKNRIFVLLGVLVVMVIQFYMNCKPNLATVIILFVLAFDSYLDCMYKSNKHIEKIIDIAFMIIPLSIALAIIVRMF